MKKIRLRSWLKATLIMWTVIDFGLITMALYMQRILELSLH